MTRRKMDKKKCPKCDGKGCVPHVMILHGIPHPNDIVCDKCNGSGELK